MKKLIVILMGLICLFPFSIYSALASTSIANDVYITQNGSLTCTLASATMVIRARAQLSGYTEYTDITENAVYGSGWIDGAGLRASFTYSFDGNSVSIGRAAASNISLATLKSVLDDHPEGISLYCRGGGESTGWSDAHAVFVTDYEGDTVYCKDPAKTSGRITLASSRLGSLYGNQASILRNVTHYWYVTSYSISPSEERGTYMTTGYDRVLPDGDYIIAACDDTKYYLDIQGYSLPAGDHDDVQLFYAESMDDIGACDVWTISYSGGFYTVRQKGTSMCLDVKGDGTVKGTDVQVFNSGNPSSSAATSSWAISRSDDDKAYHLQARSSAYYLDMEHGVGNRMNIRQWHHSTNTNDQKWVFIPYKPQQPIEAGRYMLVSALDESYIMDVAGDTGEIQNDTNVRLWSDTADNQYNCFDLIPLDNGYYKILHTTSGKALDVHGASLENRGNISLYDDNGNPSQQWAIIRNGSGYTIWARCSGKVIDMVGYEAKNGVNIFQYYYIGSPIQTWKFVPAENAVTFDASGGENAPAAQTKYYRNVLTLSDAVPVRAGYAFLGWATEPGGAAAYQPGDVYEADVDIALYAVWQRTYETVLALPAALTRIEAEAFADVAADAMTIPAGVTEIGEGAFGDVVILGYAGTAAEEYADANGLTFIPLDAD